MVRGYIFACSFTVDFGQYLFTRLFPGKLYNVSSMDSKFRDDYLPAQITDNLIFGNIQVVIMLTESPVLIL
jgi:hypothetical protein